MPFTTNYIDLCIRLQSKFRKQTAGYGDWYFDTRNETMHICDESTSIDYRDGNYFYIPDLEDLHGILAAQLETLPPPKSYKLCLDENGSWNTTIRTGSTMVAGNGESPNTALLNALYQLAFAKRRLSAGEP